MLVVADDGTQKQYGMTRSPRSSLLPWPVSLVLVGLVLLGIAVTVRNFLIHCTI